METTPAHWYENPFVGCWGTVFTTFGSCAFAFPRIATWAGVNPSNPPPLSETLFSPLFLALVTTFSICLYLAITLRPDAVIRGEAAVAKAESRTKLKCSYAMDIPPLLITKGSKELDLVAYYS